MKIAEVMTRDVRICHPEDTVHDAARTMAELDIGVLPVGDTDRLLGMITDRDIAVRAVAEGKGPETSISEVMSPEILYCFEDEDTSEVARNMAEIKVRRLPVVDREKRLCGIVSIGDLGVTADDREVASAVDGISEPGGPHSQAAG